MEANALASWLAKIPGEAVAVEDVAGQLVSVNGVLCRVLGYESDELVGKPWVTLLPGPAEGPDRPISQYETYLRCKDGNTVPVLATAWRLPIRGDPGQRRLSVFALRGELQHIQDGPDREEEVAAGDHRLASVAHELNNSLTVITLQSQLLARLDAASPRFGEHLAILQDQVAHMKRIVRELQVSSDLNGPQFEATDVNVLVQRTLDIQAFELQQADVQVVTDLGPDLPQVQADPHRLEQVFVNLIKNACQALSEANHPRLLWVSTRSVAGPNGRSPSIRIGFANNGPAIPRHLLSRIFEPFFTTKEPGQGTGLGLTVCARIVREHNGRIWAESGSANGALFVVEVPTESAAEAGPRLPPVASAPEPALQTTSRTTATGVPILAVEGEADAPRLVERLRR